MIDITKEEINLTITKNAIDQVNLIKNNDFTVSDQVFRLKIDGKGCSGFDYAMGFTTPNSDDLIIPLSQSNQTIEIYIDPFTAYYCKNGTIDFIFDLENNIDGFHFSNPNEKEYRGKFFKNLEKTPKLKKK